MNHIAITLQLWTAKVHLFWDCKYFNFRKTKNAWRCVKSQKYNCWDIMERLARADHC